MADSFQRARSAEQRAARRAAILLAARAMLDDGTRVLDLSLNELAKEVGLAKSNLLRYFETKEAVLLALLGQEYDQWLDALEDQLGSAPTPDDLPAKVDLLAVAVADSIRDRTVLAELLAASALILEHNVSLEAAADYKRRSISQAERLARLAERILGPVSQPSQFAIAGGVNLILGGAWGACRPSPGMAQAYQAYPELAAVSLDYALSVRELVATLLTGVVHRPVRL